ncbi:hypothetical protein [Planctomicrobium piriforme]|uniref:Uncharacterized protein n=1 Tax=Planctomicrobium piriforme TaxID=1576369 RepID=A0A1I3EE37_9PLAN|nr:hypothetical protein [Planctomicrobium piriforme]SFH97168.1 hypothetical protein SAMN05421753_104181 [Planctomicrobium piriforme]
MKLRKSLPVKLEFHELFHLYTHEPKDQRDWMAHTCIGRIRVHYDKRDSTPTDQRWSFMFDSPLSIEVRGDKGPFSSRDVAIQAAIDFYNDFLESLIVLLKGK